MGQTESTETENVASLGNMKAAGDIVGGDKIGGDKVAGDKVINNFYKTYEMAPPSTTNKKIPSYSHLPYYCDRVVQEQNFQSQFSLEFFKNNIGPYFFILYGNSNEEHEHFWTTYFYDQILIEGGYVDEEDLQRCRFSQNNSCDQIEWPKVLGSVNQDRYGCLLRALEKYVSYISKKKTRKPGFFSKLFGKASSDKKSLSGAEDKTVHKDDALIDSLYDKISKRKKGLFLYSGIVVKSVETLEQESKLILDWVGFWSRWYKRAQEKNFVHPVFIGLGLEFKEKDDQIKSYFEEKLSPKIKENNSDCYNQSNLFFFPMLNPVNVEESKVWVNKTGFNKYFVENDIELDAIKITNSIEGFYEQQGVENLSMKDLKLALNKILDENLKS